jgi:hypothetical protein
VAASFSWAPLALLLNLLCRCLGSDFVGPRHAVPGFDTKMIDHF